MAIKMLGQRRSILSVYWLGLGLARAPLITSLLAALNSCSLGRSGVEVEPPDELRYWLRLGESEDYPLPLPRLTRIYAEKAFDTDKATSQLAFRAWDFNRDGRYDLVEVLDADGQLSHRLFDLDFDGLVDLEKSGRP